MSFRKMADLPKKQVSFDGESITARQGHKTSAPASLAVNQVLSPVPDRVTGQMLRLRQPSRQPGFGTSARQSHKPSAPASPAVNQVLVPVPGRATIPVLQPLQPSTRYWYQCQVVEYVDQCSSLSSRQPGIGTLDRQSNKTSSSASPAVNQVSVTVTGRVTRQVLQPLQPSTKYRYQCQVEPQDQYRSRQFVVLGIYSTAHYILTGQGHIWDICSYMYTYMYIDCHMILNQEYC